MNHDGVSVRAVEQKRALRATLRGNRRPPKDVADVIGVSYPVLMAWADQSIDEHMPTYRQPAVLSVSDDLTYVRYLASLQGATVVHLPTARPGVADVCQFRRIALTFADFLERHVKATEDGRWDRAEAQAMEVVGKELAALVAGHIVFAHRQADFSEGAR